MSNRLEWIDTAKGLGIILVILGHSLTLSPHINNYIYSFHMPFFFFISGYLFSGQKYAELKQFASKKVRSLLIPYIVFAVISYIYWIFFQTQMGNDIKHPDIFHLFIGIFYSNPNGHYMSFNVALWFLTCLFCTEIIFFIIAKKYKELKKLLVLLVVFSVVGYICSLNSFIKLPWSLDVAFSAVVFYGAGYFYKVFNVHDLLQKSTYNKFVLLLIIPASFILSQLNSNVDMASNRLNNYFLFYIVACLGIFCWLNVANYLKKSQILNWIGQNSLIIFALQLKMPVDFFIQRVICLKPETINGDIYGIVYLIVSLLFFIPLVWFIDKLLPKKQTNTVIDYKA